MLITINDQLVNTNYILDIGPIQKYSGGMGSSYIQTTFKFVIKMAAGSDIVISLSVFDLQKAASNRNYAPETWVEITKDKIHRVRNEFINSLHITEIKF